MSELDWDEDETTGVWIPHTTLFQLLDTIEKEWGKRKAPSCLSTLVKQRQQRDHAPQN